MMRLFRQHVRVVVADARDKISDTNADVRLRPYSAERLLAGGKANRRENRVGERAVPSDAAEFSRRLADEVHVAVSRQVRRHAPEKWRHRFAPILIGTGEPIGGVRLVRALAEESLDRRHLRIRISE